MRKILLTLMGVITFMTNIANSENLDNILYMDLKNGRVEIEMRPDLAPLHVARIKELVRKKFYDGLLFHRVIPGFMAQTGDPKGDGTGGTGIKLKAEFSKESHVRGTMSMARNGFDINSGDSQFFICFESAPHLDGQYTIWGKVIKGMEFVDQIKKGTIGNNGAVSDPDKIISMRVAGDESKSASSQQ